MIKGFLATLALVAVTMTAASAQWYPGQYNGQYGQYGYGQPRQTQGIVASFNAFDLYLQSGRQQNEYVHLHQGTIINPRGTTLQSGMPVRVLGYVDGSGTFQANEIDVGNNGNCGYQNNGRYNGGYNNGGYNNGGYNNGGYYGNGPYGNGHYNGPNGNGQYGGCYGNGRRHHRHDNDNDDRDDDEDGGDGPG